MLRIGILLCCCVYFSDGQNNFSVTARDGGGNGWGWSGSSSSSGLQSFFDIALTALAFLSFGIFLLNLLLNALLFTGGATTGLTASGPIITNTGVTTTGGATAGTATGGRRNRRSVFELYLDPVTSVDSLANTVLKSIDAMVNEHECVQKVFCDGNKQARLIKHGFEYLMPVYSVGASYIGEKLGLHEKLPEHVNAILLGVNESNCQSHFPQC